MKQKNLEKHRKGRFQSKHTFASYSSTTFRTLYKVHSINLIETSKCGGTSRILQESFKLTK